MIEPIENTEFDDYLADWHEAMVMHELRGEFGTAQRLHKAYTRLVRHIEHWAAVNAVHLVPYQVAV